MVDESYVSKNNLNKYSNQLQFRINLFHLNCIQEKCIVIIWK